MYICSYIEVAMIMYILVYVMCGLDVAELLYVTGFEKSRLPRTFINM